MNSTSNFKFTIVIPLYNERENLERLESTVTGYLDRCVLQPACALIVDDGSTDGGSGQIAGMCAGHDNLFYIRFQKNCGLSAALKAGFENCQSEYVGYMDADLQTDPRDFDLLLARIPGNALVTGIRTGRKDGFVKKASSKIANSWRRMMTHDGAIDTGCPLKVLRTSYAKRLPLFKGMHRFIPALVLMLGGTYEQIPVRHLPRVAGKAKYHLLNRLWGPFIDCFAYRWMRRRNSNFIIESTDLK